MKYTILYFIKVNSEYLWSIKPEFHYIILKPTPIEK